MTTLVVLTYNQLEDCTKPCIESIYQYTDINSFELIIVDNDSQDGTKEYLISIKDKYPNIKIMLNDVNKGYSGGNNDGIRASKGEFVVLLNNDTLVSENWLVNLLIPFSQDKKVGLVGPISNSVGNEQRVNIDGLNEKNYNEKSKEYTIPNKGISVETQRLGFFCVAIRKEVIDTIGLLDEQFGIGMFEDDDFCIRSTKAGYKNIFVEDSFVYHKGSVSFKKLTSEIYQELFKKNHAYFLSKHNVEWCLSDIAFSYWNKFNDDLEDYKKHKNESAINRINTRFENFKHLLFQIRSIEVQKQNIQISAEPKNISKLKWKIRFENLKAEFLFADLNSKKRYIQKVIKKLVLTKNSLDNSLNGIIQKLGEIKIGSLYKKVIIFPATIDYNYMKQRPQHLAEAFASAGYLVVYSTKNYNYDSVDIYEKIKENLILLEDKYLPYLHHIFLKEDVIFYCMWPNNKVYTNCLNYNSLIYDFMDELDILDYNQDELKLNHQFLLEKSDLITTSAQKLYDSIPESYHQKTLIIRNAVSEEFVELVQQTNEHFIPNELKLIKKSYKKILGYYGAVAEWIDFELIEYILKSLPDYAFVIIGPVFNVSEKVEYLKANYDNIFFYKEMKKEELIPYLKSFDICTIPFIKNNITDSVSPVKTYEYLAANKPVVSTNILECQQIELIDVTLSKEDFLKKLVHQDEMNLEQVNEYVQENLWSQRVNQIVQFMENIK